MTTAEKTAASLAVVRRLVFISHANPEQNDFVLWLGVQLANAGYEVWSDVTKLIGGEIFWDDIEDAIRHHSAKFVLVVSAAALKKEGVKDEINLAVMVERSQKVDKFVVPIRIDDVPFSDFKANIARKTAIDFSKSWSAGLATLFDVLERDQVPSGAVTPADVRGWCDNRYDQEKLPRREPEILVSNWLPISSLPAELSLFSIGVSQTQVRDAMSGSRLPWFQYFRLVGTFAKAPDLQAEAPNKQVECHYLIPTDEFLRGEAKQTPGVLRADARRHVVSLLRQAWNALMASKGLLPYEMANGAVAWFFPKGAVEKDTVFFVDHTGKRRRKAVVGRSEVRRVYWHLGFIAKPVLSDPPRMLLKAAIVFTEDGKKPLDSAERMHRLRRGFCRNWWNGQWRDLMLAYISWISNNQPEIAVPFGDFSAATIVARPLAFVSPFAFQDPAPKTQNQTLVDDEVVPPDVPIEQDEELGADGLDEEGDDV